MSYLQLETTEGYLSRSLTLSPLAKIGGYPGYLASITDQRRSVRTILYMENDILYLTNDKTFFLSQVPNNYGGWIFTSNPNAEPLTLSLMQATWGNIRVWPWRNEWANMRTDDPNRNNLIWPVRTWEEAWNYIRTEIRDYHVLFRRIETEAWDARWLTPVDSFGGTTFVTGAFAWKNHSPAPFFLHRRGNDWTLQYRDDGTLHADVVINFEGNRSGAYIVPWSSGASSRWVLGADIEGALFFQVNSPEDGIYTFNYGDRKLNQGGCWEVRPFSSCVFGTSVVTDGVEFYNDHRNEGDERSLYLNMYVVAPALTDTQRYILGQNQFVNLMRDQNNFLPDYDPIGVTENLPLSGAICNENEWEGTNINCYQRANTPYTHLRGQELCTTLDDFSNDIHCQQWAVTNKGPQIDQRLYGICRDVPIDQYQSVCGCYRTDDVYYNQILQQRRDDPELARQIANDVRATNLLQCTSGLCVPGTFSANTFYHGSRRCDVCIQAMRLDIRAGGNITGNINPIQVCTQTVATYSWQELISRLEELGAYRNVRDENGTVTTIGTHPHVIINVARTSIKLITSTTGGRQILQLLPTLRVIDSRDQYGNIIVTQDRWRNTPEAMSTDIMLFMVKAREDV